MEVLLPSYASYTVNDNDNNNNNNSNKSILTSGDQMYGMSGCPVFNGCGLVAIATTKEVIRRAEIITVNVVDEEGRLITKGLKIPYLTRSGTGAVHKDHLLLLLHHQDIMKYRIIENKSKKFKIIDIPTKHYCKNNV